MRITVKVKTNSKKQEIIQEDNSYKVFLKSQPIEGKANEELIKLLSKHFKKKVKIVSGLRGKEKIVELI
jgi:uncharacterized protein